MSSLNGMRCSPLDQSRCSSAGLAILWRRGPTVLRVRDTKDFCCGISSRFFFFGSKASRSCFIARERSSQGFRSMRAGWQRRTSILLCVLRPILSFPVHRLCLSHIMRRNFSRHGSHNSRLPAPSWCSSVSVTASLSQWDDLSSLIRRRGHHVEVMLALGRAAVMFLLSAHPG